MKKAAVLFFFCSGLFLFAQNAAENSELRDIFNESTYESKKPVQSLKLEDAEKDLEEGVTKKKNETEEKKLNPEEYLRYLKSENPKEVMIALKIMGASKQKRYTKEIAPFLKSKDPLIVEAAIEAYGFAKDEGSVVQLRPMLKVQNKSIRYVVLKSLYNIAGPKAEDLIIELLDDGDGSMRVRAAETLASMKCKVAWSRLARSMCCDPSPGVRRSAAMALSEILNPNSIKDLKTSLEDPDKTVAFYCAVSLAKMKDKSGMKLLIKMLEFDDANTRALALDALACLDTRDIIAPVNKMVLNEKNPGLAKRAGKILKKLEEKYK